MRDTNQRSNRLVIAVLVFVALIIIGFISLRQPQFEYRLSPDETLQRILKGKDEISSDKAKKIILNQTQGYVFVDIRNPYEFQKGNIKGSVNIPLQNLLADKNVKFFDKAKEDFTILVIYGWDQSEANGPWMVLKQLGYNNAKILQGGYGFYSGEAVQISAGNETPQYKISGVMEMTGESQTPQTEAPPEQIVTVKRRKKQSLIEAGC